MFVETKSTEIILTGSCLFVWRLQRKEAEETYLKMEINKIRIKNLSSFLYVVETRYFGNIIFLLLLVFFQLFF